MLEITYLGHSSFRIAGKDVSIVTDPYSKGAFGASLPSVSPDVVTISHEHQDHNNREGVKGSFVCFDSPGEYEIKGVEINGIRSFHDEVQGQDQGGNTIFIYNIDEIKLCHLGDLGHELSAEQIEKINGVDVLIIPVGGKYTISAKKAAKVISSIGPKIVIPAHFRSSKASELDGVEEFLKEIGVEAKRVKELRLKQKDLPEAMEVYLFEPKTS